jgi:hypothetical protein
VLELQIDTPPRGWRLPSRAKSSALAESLQQALEHLTLGNSVNADTS